MINERIQLTANRQNTEFYEIAPALRTLPFLALNPHLIPHVEAGIRETLVHGLPDTLGPNDWIGKLEEDTEKAQVQYNDTMLELPAAAGARGHAEAAKAIGSLLVENRRVHGDYLLPSHGNDDSPEIKMIPIPVFLLAAHRPMVDDAVDRVADTHLSYRQNPLRTPMHEEARRTLSGVPLDLQSTLTSMGTTLMRAMVNRYMTSTHNTITDAHHVMGVGTEEMQERSDIAESAVDAARTTALSHAQMIVFLILKQTANLHDSLAEDVSR